MPPKNKNKNKKQRPSPKPLRPVIQTVIRADAGPRMDKQFALAMRSPFAPGAMGVRVPDPYSFPTAPYHLNQETVITADASGNAAVVFYPNPLVSMTDAQRAAGGTACITSSGMTQFAANPGVYRLTDATSLTAAFDSYRTVHHGLKLSSLMPQLSATGRIIVAFLPCTGEMPGVNALSAQTTDNFHNLAVGLPAAAIASSALLQKSTAFEITAADLAHGDVEIAGCYTNATFWRMRQTNNSNVYAAGFYQGNEAVFAAGTGIPLSGAIDDSELTDCAGGVAIALFFEGCIPSTRIALLETLMHIEGTPAIVATAAGTPLRPIPSGLFKTHVGSGAELDRAMAANGPHNCASFVDRASDFLNSAKPAIKAGIKYGPSIVDLVRSLQGASAPKAHYARLMN